MVVHPSNENRAGGRLQLADSVFPGFDNLRRLPRRCGGILGAVTGERDQKDATVATVRSQGQTHDLLFRRIACRPG